MTKIKNLFALLAFSLLIYSCGSSDTDPVDNFDHEAQALIDNDSLVKFLKNHYFDTVLDSVKLIENGQQSLFDDSKLKTMNVVEEEVNYKLYVYVNKVGTPVPNKISPTVMDSVYVKYYGQSIVSSATIGDSFDDNDGLWFTLNSVIRGWAYGFTNFKAGKNITDNGPITYEGGGKGVLFIPSGLAYRNVGNANIIPNENLLFYIDLYDLVENTDHDNDGVPSIMEDPDGDGNPGNDDTDGDFTANYLDTDDDGDGVYSIDEDANKDGNPANDFSDPNNPTLPDYLNPAIKKIN